MLCASVVSSWAIGGDGLYFANSFEASDNVPAMADVVADTETPVNIAEQGEWLYYNAFYNDDTSTGYMGNGDQNLRLPKKGYGKIGASNGSYVVSPLLSNGVSKVTFHIGRASVKVYTSTDGGATWATAETTTSGKTVTATINSDAVNRIKIANDASKDADIDDVAIYAQTYDTPVTLSTGDATDIAKTSANVSGVITKQDRLLPRWASYGATPIKSLLSTTSSPPLQPLLTTSAYNSQSLLKARPITTVPMPSMVTHRPTAK